MLVVGKRYELYAGSLEGLFGHREAVGVRRYHAHYLAACSAQCLYSFERAAAGADEILDYHHLLARFELPLDEVLHAMVLGLRAYVDEWQTEFVGHEGSLGDGPCGYAGHYLGLWKMLKHGMGQCHLHERAYVGIGERLAVVAVER